MTYDSESTSTYVGACFYNCITTISSYDLYIWELPKKIINTDMARIAYGRW